MRLYNVNLTKIYSGTASIAAKDRNDLEQQLPDLEDKFDLSLEDIQYQVEPIIGLYVPDKVINKATQVVQTENKVILKFKKKKHTWKMSNKIDPSDWDITIYSDEKTMELKPRLSHE